MASVDTKIIEPKCRTYLSYDGISYTALLLIYDKHKCALRVCRNILKASPVGNWVSQCSFILTPVVGLPSLDKVLVPYVMFRKTPSA